MTVHSWPPSPGRRPPARPAPYRPARYPRARLHPRQRANLTTAAFDEMLVDEIASRVTGDMVNAGIASIDARWSAGQSLENTLGTYTRLAHQAYPVTTQQRNDNEQYNQQVYYAHAALRSPTDDANQQHKQAETDAVNAKRTQAAVLKIFV